MTSAVLDEKRCEKCQKLLFRGLVGIGFIEVKCTRCGHVNLLNSFDAMLHGTPGAYILVYDMTGNLIATSKSAERILGYGSKELQSRPMSSIDETFELRTIAESSQEKTLAEWERQHKSLSRQVSHLTKEGDLLQNHARYYPIGVLTGVYTIGIFYTHQS
jgi:PAS domain S-box-containing protein